MAMDVTLRQLRAYVAVLETASFSEAAKAMHLSQAALSGLIKELESRVGVRLLDRTTRKVSASAVGETFAPMARRVLVQPGRGAGQPDQSQGAAPRAGAGGGARNAVLHAAAGADRRIQRQPSGRRRPVRRRADPGGAGGPAERLYRHRLRAGRRGPGPIGRSAHDLRRPAMGGVAQRRSADQGRSRSAGRICASGR